MTNRVLKFAALWALALLAALAIAQAPQIPVTGTIGPGGLFAFRNASPVSITSDANHTMAYPETSGGFVKVTSTISLTATRNVVEPFLTNTQCFENLTTGGQAIQIIGASGTGVTIANGSYGCVQGDGTNYITATGSGGSGTVTSVSIASPLGSLFGCSTSNPTTTPNIVCTVLNAGQNTFYAGPATGGAGTPLFRNITSVDIGLAGPLSNSTSGNAATATSLAATPSLCTTGQVPTGVLANGNATGCATPPLATLQTNGTNNGSQTMLNLVGGSNVTLNNTGGVTTINAGGVPVPSANLLALYDTANGSGATLADLSGNGNSAPLCTGSYGTTPTWNTGGYGLAFSPYVYTDCVGPLPSALNAVKSIVISLYITPMGSAVSPGVNLGALFGSLFTSSVLPFYSSVGLVATSTTSNATQMYTPNMFNLSKPPEYPYSGYQVIGVDFGNWNGSACTSYDTYYLNGVALPGTYITPGCSGGRATTGNFFIGPAPAGPGSGPNWQGTQYIFPGSLYSMALYSANLGASGQATAAAAFRAKNNAGGALIVPSSPNIASPRNYCIGDSITAGYSSYLTLTPYCQIVPAQLNGVPFTSTVLNAISGITTAADIASEAYRTAPNCQTPSGPSYASLLTGTNDFLFFTSDTGQTVYSKNAQEAHILKFFGCRVVVGSMLSRGGWNGTVPAATACTTFELCKNALNPLLSSGVANGAFDGYIDYASHVGLGADGASTKTLWRASYAYVSGVGYQIIDSNGNLESLTTAGTSGSTQPTWCITVSCTNTDGGAVWTVTQLAPVGRCHTAASTTPAFGGTAACFQYDETHPTQAGQQELANIYANVYNRIFGYSALNPRVISSGSTYQMLPADGAITYTGASTFTLTLPDCTGMTGLTFTIADTVDEAVTINAMGSTQPINGLLNISLGGNDSAVLTATANPYSTSGCHWSY